MIPHLVIEGLDSRLRELWGEVPLVVHVLLDACPAAVASFEVQVVTALGSFEVHALDSALNATGVGMGHVAMVPIGGLATSGRWLEQRL